MMKASGSLLVKESHSLPPLKTTYGNDVDCSIFVLRNLSTDDDAKIGLKFSIKEEYGTKSALLDFSELDGLLSSINIIQTKGMEICTTPTIEVPSDSENSTEIDYISKDGLSFGA